MQNELLPYYERELTYLRQMAKDFARKYPKIADRLLLDSDRSQDPHVERLLQGFAFLAARIHRKLDDGLPEVSESLLNILYPHYLAPIPSMSIVQFTPDPTQGALSGGYSVDRHTVLYSKPINGTPCQFRTAYPVTLWPIELRTAQLCGPDQDIDWPANAGAVLKLELQALEGLRFSDLSLDTLRFYLNGESRFIYKLYELLFNNVVRTELRSHTDGKRTASVVLPEDALQPVGFGRDEGLLPYPLHSFIGYRLLQEYFTFPEKFLFIDVRYLERAKSVGESETIEILIYLDQLPPQKEKIGKENFLLGCTPVVNLFHKIAEPITIDHTKTEYPLIPDLRRQPALEVYSVDKVMSTTPYLDRPLQYQPFYSYRHALDDAPGTENVFWYAGRRPSLEANDRGTDVYLSLVNLDFRPACPEVETLTVYTTCTNRDLPRQLPFSDPKGDLELEGAAPIALIRCLKKPSSTCRPALGGAAQWRLISHLSLNYLSLTREEEGRKALQEILKLYDFTDSAITQQQISGIERVDCRPAVRRIHSQHGGSVARGMKIFLVLDEEKFVGSGLYLFASVLEKFLGLYVSVNSFCELEVTTKQRMLQKKGSLKIWPPRSGEQILL